MPIGRSLCACAIAWLACAVLAAPAAQAQSRQQMPGPLSKAHAALGTAAECQLCHKPGGGIESSRCLQCHEPIAARMAAKKGVHREVTGDCEGCHVEHQGADADLRPLDPSSFSHVAETGFPLTGAHASLAERCSACHKGRSFLDVTPQCSSCHRDAHRGTLGVDCAACHTPPGAPFRTASRAFHQAGLFALEGRHLTVPCASCHLDGVIKGTPTRCYDCHWVRRQDDRYRTRLGSDCETCHRPTSWTAVRWNHAAATGVALNPSHRTLACESCHTGQAFRGTALRCESCHQADYQRAANPNHVSAGFPMSCESCHLPSHTAWSQSTFSHRAVFTLVGVHATLACSSCHRGAVYRGTPRDCVGCHKEDYQRTSNPNHQAAGFGTECNSCHRPTDASFRGATFNHGAAFRLVGVHAAQACAACHKGGVYKGTPRDCVGCHQADYQRTTAPNHQAAGFPTTCDSCHRPTDTSFRDGSSSHSYRLVGVHATQACTACHKNNVFKGTPRDCVGCHQADYQRTTAPNHQAAGFPTTCDSCHRPTDPSFRGGSSSHSYPLVGVHATQACTACHRNNVFKGTPRDCVGCHQADYQRTTAPNHQAAGFPTTCDSCHRQSDASWRGASFNHARVYPLLGTHSTQQCSACHKNNVYRGTPRDCVACHLSRYQQTTNPNHQAAGFPTTCEACHRASDPSWRDAVFNHTWFPITSGRHAGRACAECHTDPANYKVFNCLRCHSRSSVEEEHQGNPAFRYESAACYSCHPTGRS